MYIILYLNIIIIIYTWTQINQSLRLCLTYYNKNERAALFPLTVQTIFTTVSFINLVLFQVPVVESSSGQI